MSFLRVFGVRIRMDDKQKKRCKQIVICIFLLAIISVANYKNYKVEEPLPSYIDSVDVENDNLSEEVNNDLEVTDIPKKEYTANSDNDGGEKSNNSGLSGSNYLVYAVDTNGVLVKWNKKKIKVNVAPSIYNNVIRSALRTYNNAFNGYFEFVPSKRNFADITIDIVDSLESLSSQSEIYMAGLTNNIFEGSDKHLSSSSIKLLSVKPNSKLKVTEDEMYAVIMHELGHALGIVGHSQDESDVMFAFTSKNTGHLSQRDITTIKMMYSNDKELIKRETASFAQRKLDEAKAYVKSAPNKAVSWINLGKVYYDVNMKEAALDAYKKALTIEPSNPNIYLSMAECYYNSEKYNTAIKYYNYAIQKSADESSNSAIYNMIGLCYARMDDVNNSYLSFEKAFNYNKSNKSVLFNLLTLCVELKKKTEAKNFIEQYKSAGGDMSDSKINKAIKDIERL
ncbi:tetratricopeptide repeat protein [bacterium]|nr:tetratricopeptide repeat protein [bacterium]